MHWMYAFVIIHICNVYACMYDTMDSESVPAEVLAEMPRDLNQGLTKDLLSNYDFMYGRIKTITLCLA